MITTLLQSQATHGGVREDTFTGRLQAQCAEHGLAVPSIPHSELRAVRDAYERRRREQAAPETLEVGLPRARDGDGLRR